MAKFIVIDGLDGCGKATQTKLLEEELVKLGKKVKKIEFPKYDSDSSAAVKMYLNGELGNDPTKLNPYMCSSFYAVDRFIQYETDWKKYFEEDDNTVIIADRYLSANIIHQGGKLEIRSQRASFNKWVYEFECEKCGLPKEDLTIILSVQPEISQKLMTKRYEGDESKKDIHEGNLEYLNNCYERLKTTIEDLTYSRELVPGIKWIMLDCTELDSNGDMTGIVSKETVHKAIMHYVNKVLNNEEIDKHTISDLCQWYKNK